MLTKEDQALILDFCQIAPRSVAEIAAHIGKSWRTTNAYVERIAEETGLIAIKVFRGGTQGALKVVYWCRFAPRDSSARQVFEDIILTGREKAAFSPMDIVQLCDRHRRRILLGQNKWPGSKEYLQGISKATHSIHFFSGNLSWIKEDKQIIELLQKLATSGVYIKILTRIDIVSEPIVHRLMSINARLPAERVQIRHRAQPLRGCMVDESFLSLREELAPKNYPELQQCARMVYLITDPNWCSWACSVFARLWELSTPADERLKLLHTIERIDAAPAYKAPMRLRKQK